MEKSILLKIGNQEHIIKVVGYLTNAKILPNTNFTIDKNSSQQIPILLSPFLRLELNYKIEINYENKNASLEFKVYLQREDNFDPMFDLDEYEYKISYLKYIQLVSNLQEYRNHPLYNHIFSLVTLVNSCEISNKSIETEFLNLNYVSNLISFNSYKDFKYGLFLKFYPKKKVNANLNEKIIGENYSYQYLPLNHKNFMIEDRGGMFPRKLQPDLYNLKIRKPENPLFTGTIEDVLEIFNNDEKSQHLRKVYFEKEKEKERKRNSSFDIRDTIDYSNYNDDLDMDQQSSDFWNQF